MNASAIPGHLPSDPYTAADDAAATLRALTGAETHDVALVMGSGWLPAADQLGPADHEFPVTELPGFPPPAVEGHAGTFRSQLIEGRRALVFLGRTHFYEGRGVAAVVHGVRTAVAAGCKTIVLTNGCGGLREGMAPGQPVLISDHLNLTASSPVVGANFIDLTDLYRRAARPVQGDRPEPGGGRLRPVHRAALRDARRDPDGPHPRRRPGRHVDRAGGHRRP